jgi:GAF domain-containing protein
MFSGESITAASKTDLYQAVREQLTALLEGERDPIANAANMASLLFHTLPDLNWAGFYFLKAGELVLGPFQGKPACVRIPLGNGVCGTAAQSRTTVVVPDVDVFPGHIACDSASRSEIVVPLITGGRLIGVLDIDSPNVGRFDDEDRVGCQALVQIFLERTDFA